MGSNKWFERKFDFRLDADRYAAIYERLREAPERLVQLLDAPPSVLVDKQEGKWSIKEHAGHLSVLEPIWRIRFQDIQESKPVLTPADLDNKATTEAGFNHTPVAILLENFKDERKATLSYLDSIDALDGSRTSLHPRLQQPMRVIDLAYFVAEHDEHHFSKILEIIAQHGR